MSSDQQPSRNSFPFLRFSYFLATAFKILFLLGIRTEDNTSLKIHCRHTTALFFLWRCNTLTYITNLTFPKILCKEPDTLNLCRVIYPDQMTTRKVKAWMTTRKIKAISSTWAQSFPRRTVVNFSLHFFKSECLLSFTLLGSWKAFESSPWKGKELWSFHVNTSRVNTGF